MLSAVFVWPIRVYYEDTDAGGMVYHSRYLNFLERARSEWLRSLGFEQDQLMHEHGIVFVVSKMEIKYLRPARFNDQLSVHVRLLEFRKVSLIFSQKIYLASDDAHLIDATVKIACIDVVRNRPHQFPQSLFQAIEHEL